MVLQKNTYYIFQETYKVFCPTFGDTKISEWIRSFQPDYPIITFSTHLSPKGLAVFDVSLVPLFHQGLQNGDFSSRLYIYQL